MPRTLLLAVLAIGLVGAAAQGSESAAEGSGAGSVFNYSGSGAVLLRGPWERYDGAAPIVAEGAARGGSASFLLLRQLTPDFGASVRDETIYRIAIRIAAGDPARRMAVYVPAFAGVSAVYANGELLYDKGRGPSSPPLILFDAPSGKVDLALRLETGSRPLEAASSYPSFVLFGDAESAGRALLWAGAAAALSDGFFAVLGLSVLALYLFWKKNREFIAFAAFLLAAGASYGFLHCSLFAGLREPRALIEIARLLLVDLQLLAVAYFLGCLYRSLVKGPLAAVLYAIPTVLAVAAAAAVGEATQSLLSPLYVATEAYAALFGLATLAFLSLRLAKGDKRARWLTPATLVLLSALALGRSGPDSLLTPYAIPNAGTALFSILVFLMLIKKVADSFESAELLTDYVASVSRAVKSFIPKEFLEHLSKTDLVDLRLGDHAKKEMTIFFSDIRAFTQLSEGLTVEENFAFINSYLARVVPIIKENGGFVDKYVGDGIMALFPGPKGPDEAIRSAIAMQAKMVEYNGHRAKMGYKPISMGVGVHTGDLMLGVVGVEERMENTVISDAVNLSSRLQAIAKAFNISLAISEKAFKELEDPGVYKYRFIGKVKVKGKAAPISVFEIFDGIEPDIFERKMRANMFFEQGMLSYYQKDFASAMYYFKRVLEILPEDGAAGFYLDNCMNRATL
jgi:two-component system sensor histidine kinase ChiS